MNFVMMLICFLLAFVFSFVTLVFQLSDNRRSGGWHMCYVCAKKLYEYTTIAHVCVGLVWLFVEIPLWSFYISGALFVLAFLLWFLPDLRQYADFVRSVFRMKGWKR